MSTRMENGLLDLLQEYATDDAAIQLYAYPQGGNWATDTEMKRILPFADDPQAFIEANKDKNVYFNTCLMEESKSGRGGSKDARIVPMLFADLDAAEGVHNGERATKKELAEMLKSGEVVPMPSMVVDSGGGLHAYWVLEEPIRINSKEDRDKAEALLLGLNNKIRDWHKSKGYKYERLKDLARVLRVPGSFNHKTETPKQVKTLLPKQGEKLVKFAAEQLTFAETEKVKDDATPEFDTLEVDQDVAMRRAIAACTKIEPVWGNDASGYVLKCCRQCVRAGCEPEVAVKVVRAMDKLMGPLPKHWTDAEIIRRYNDALTQSELGEAIEPYENTEWGFARWVCDTLKGRAKFIQEWGKWVSWTGKRFEVGVAKEVMLATVEVSKELLLETPRSDGTKEGDQAVKAHVAFCLKYQTNAGMEAVRRIAEKLMACSFESLDKRYSLFHCDNTTLQLNDATGEIVGGKGDAHNPENENTLISSVVYNPEAKWPTWDKFIREIAVDDKGVYSPGLACYLQRIAGFCLTGRVDNQSIYILYGSGRNGKGTFCRALLKMLGSFGASIKQELLVGKNQGHDTKFATLYSKRLVIAQETDQGCHLNEAQVKWLTGSDPINCRRMREDEWEFQPTHKLMLATNNLPIIKGTDEGIWRRVKLIPFNAHIPVADKDLEPKLHSELSGILNWALEGYKKACGPLGLSEPSEVTTAKADYKADMDIVAQFVEDQCILDPKLTTNNTAIYQAFKLYCDQIGQHVPSIRKLTIDLDRMGIKSGRTTRERFKVGIGLRSEAPSEFDDDVF